MNPTCLWLPGQLPMNPTCLWLPGQLSMDPTCLWLPGQLSMDPTCLWLPGQLSMMLSTRPSVSNSISQCIPCVYEGGRRTCSPAVACWASDHWVDGSNPLRGKFRH